MSDTEDHAAEYSNGDESPPKPRQRFRDRSKVKLQPKPCYVFHLIFDATHDSFLIFTMWVLFGFTFGSTQEMLSKQAVQTKQMLSKQAVKIAKQAEEHERFINKVTFFVFLFQNVCFF